MITNINYKGRVRTDLSQFNFGEKKPKQCVKKIDGRTIIIFQNGSCRVMGCKEKINGSLPYGIILDRIQSISAYFDLNIKINLFKLSQRIRCIYEPELFPAMQLIKYKPMCVNVFQSGKVTILGLKTFDFIPIIHEIRNYIMCHL